MEIVGKVNRDLSVRVLKATDMGRDGKCWVSFLGCEVFGDVDEYLKTEADLLCTVDFASVSAVVDATHRYKEIFYSDS